MATKELLNENGSEQTGSLFWLVHRCNDKTKANMFLEAVTWEQHVTLHMPFKRQKHAVEWEPKDLPTVPVLYNKFAIKAHERLAVHFERKDLTKKEEAKEDKK